MNNEKIDVFAMIDEYLNNKQQENHHEALELIDKYIAKTEEEYKRRELMAKRLRRRIAIDNILSYVLPIILPLTLIIAFIYYIAK